MWQEVATLFPGGVRRSRVPNMLISSLTYRTPAQRAVTVVRAWTVGGGTRDLVRITWDPEGPMSAREAAAAAFEHAAAELRGR